MKTLTLGLLMTTLMAGACTLPAMMQGGGKGHARETTSSSSTTVEEINGRPIDPDEPAAGNDDDEAPHKKSKTKKKKEAASDFGSTCKTNKDCDSNTCFVGSGELGYCTMMCDSWSDCPSHWECQKAGNAPQRICMQDSW